MTWQSEEKAQRARIAAELDRREFWKANFLISRQHQLSLDNCTKDADKALSIFDNKFQPTPVK